jgi:RHS repeat-associated protein
MTSKLTILLLLLTGIFTTVVNGQARINGPTCIVAGSTYTYTCIGTASGGTYSIVNGINTATGGNAGGYTGISFSLNIKWNAGMTSGQVSFTATGQSQVTLAVNTGGTLVPGTISNTSQTINYNTPPATINCSVANGGNCTGSYNYQWQQSTDNVNFSNISGATAQNLSLTTGLTQKTYFRRNDAVSGGSSGNTNTATVNVYPQLVGGSVSPASTGAVYNNSPSQLSVSGISGGNGTYTYQWQSSPDNTTWTNVSGATSTTYTPPPLTSPIYYHVVVTSNGASTASNYSYISIYPSIQPGAVSPAAQLIAYNTIPSTMTLSGVSGGSGTYTYQWQSSPDNVSWGTIIGSTGTTYTPTSGLTATTFYRAQVNSSGASAYSTSAAVNTTGQLTAGAMEPGSLTLAPGTSPGILTCLPATGGSCAGSYTYQWQSSPDNSTWTNISGATTLYYSPGNLSSATYYRVQATCGSTSVFSGSVQMGIGAIATNLNYVRERTITKPGVMDTITSNGLIDPGDVKQVTAYFDGLGRSIQSVAKQASPLQKDMVTFQVYDALGREATKFIPYVSTTSDGNYKTDPYSDQTSFNNGQFPNDQFYYGAVSFEPSPLNRPTVTYAPGNSWTGAGRGTSNGYLVNLTTDSVQYWTIAATAGSLPVTSSTFAAGQLYKNTATDEAGHQVVEYKDMQGKVLLKKVQLWNTPAAGSSGWLNTYYVYDDMDNLRLVISPKAVEWLKTNSWNFANPGGPTVATELCFRYEYDARKRMIIKKIPGAGESWIVYDARDRVVLSQDSMLRYQHKWLFTRYDIENRPDSTGTINDSANYNNLSFHQNLASSSTSYPSLTTYGKEVLTQTFYDNYNWTSAAGLPSTMATTYTSNSAYFITNYTPQPYAVAITAHPITLGLPTGTMVKVIGTGSQYLSTVNFYDDRGRVIQTQATNYTGGIDTLTTQYTFIGTPLRTLVNHRKNGNIVQNHTVLTKLNYDAGVRLKNIYKNIDNLGDQLIDSLTYNELGQLTGKYLGNNVDSLLYAYNIRGWMTSINKNYLGGTQSSYFGAELSYDRTSSVTGWTYAGTQFNGNIAGTTWKGGDGVARRYDFNYDNLNRLTAALFTQNNAGVGDSSKVNFSTSNISYDPNGNILTMNQSGLRGVASAMIDQLTYSYATTSNRLMQVADAANDSLSQLGDFHFKGSKQASDYGYDGNGSMTHDNNKAIDTIVYNYLSLPQRVHINGKGIITYTYDAGGNKLSKVVTDSLVRHTTTTIYVAGMVYQQTDTITNPTGGIDTLQFLLHEEGRARWAYHRWTNGTFGYKWEYDFFEKDHLGNVRTVLTQQKDTAQYLATMEAAYRATENALFYNIPSTCVWSYYVNGATNPFGTTVTNPNDSVSRISGSTPKEGPAIILKVMAGDQFKVGVNAYWKSGQTSTGTTDALTEILSSLANGIVAASGTSKGSYSTLSNTSTSPLLGGVNAFRTADNPTPPTNPKAYLNYMALDDQFNYDPAASGALAVGAADNLSTLATGTITIKKNGYLYIYVTNETKSVSVFFDNLSVTHYPGPLLEETHYYPFGLTMAGISDKALKGNYAENKYRFNKGSELQNKEFSDGSGLEMYTTNLRDLDPQLGRWWQIDAKPNVSESPYASMGNNPILHNDPLGDSIIGKSNNAVADRIVNTANSKIAANDTKIASNNSAIKDAKDKIASGNLSAKEIKAANKTIANLTKSNTDLTGRNENLRTGIAAIAAMRADLNNNYSFESPANDDGTHHVLQGTGKNVIVEGSNTGLFLHESVHILQNLNSGGLRFSTKAETLGLLLNVGATGSHIGDEVQSYQVQFSFDGSFSTSSARNLSDINPATVRDLHDGDNYPYRNL